MKRCTYLLTALLLCAVLTVPARAARRSVPVQADGSPVAAAAYVDQGVTYVPLRALLNALGGWDVWWDSGTGQAAAAAAGELGVLLDLEGGAVAVGGRHQEAGEVPLCPEGDEG